MKCRGVIRLEDAIDAQVEQRRRFDAASEGFREWLAEAQRDPLTFAMQHGLPPPNGLLLDLYKRIAGDEA